MLRCPFDVLDCSWPSPVEQTQEPGEAEPAWIAACMPAVPRPRCEVINNALYWSINWSDFFKRCELVPFPIRGGRMRGFQVVFRLKLREAGTLQLSNVDGCVIRHNHRVIHDSRQTPHLLSQVLSVEAESLLEIAQTHKDGEWYWNASFLAYGQDTPQNPVDLLLPYLKYVQKRLTRPDGPPLRIFTGGDAPLRTVIAIFSFILNGYVPSAIHLFGEHQWNAYTYRLFSSLLPFAHVISTEQVATRISAFGTSKLLDMAYEHWFVMKACCSLLYSPQEFCSMDDDVFILRSLDEVLYAYQSNDLVYTQDQDLGADYYTTWRDAISLSLPLPTARFNAGLYWMRNYKSPQEIATRAVKVRPDPEHCPLWEQGLIAALFASDRTVELSSQRYLFPLLDGLPGGVLDYDYKQNPCGFTSIHFAGYLKKPSEGVALHIASQLLKIM